MDLLPLVFRAIHAKSRIEQVLHEVDPIVRAFHAQAPTLVPALKIAVAAVRVAYVEARPVIDAYIKQAPTLVPMAKALADEVLPGMLKEFGRVQVPVVSTEWVQRTLNKLGASPVLVIDDDMGDVTRDAIKQFQTNYNKTAATKLKVDGWAGPATIAALYMETEG